MIEPSKDGPVFTGLFYYRATLGIPVADVMRWCVADRLLFSVPHFIFDAMNGGWRSKKIRSTLLEAWVDQSLPKKETESLMRLADVFINAKKKP